MDPEIFYNNEEDVPDTPFSWSPLPFAPTPTTSMANLNLIESPHWSAHDYDSSFIGTQSPFTGNEETIFHQAPFMSVQSIEAITGNGHRVEVGTHRNDADFGGNLQSNPSPAAVPDTADAFDNFILESMMQPEEIMAPSEHFLQTPEEMVFMERSLQTPEEMASLVHYSSIPEGTALLRDNTADTTPGTGNHCPICGSSYSRPQDRDRHINSQHTMARVYHCTYDGCHRSYRRSDVLLKHRHSVHGLE